MKETKLNKTAIYCRLSQDDGMVGDSSSIQTQKMMLEQFVKDNCTHTHEPGCAVLQALDEQLISQSRYTSYLSIMEDSNPDKYRKPF